MGIVLNTNMSAIAAQNNLRKVTDRIDTTMERLSSGLRINRAADDAAGLAISERLRSQVNGLNQAQRNAQDGISVMQTADGGLNETHAILQRMRTLAVQAANGTNSQENLAQIQAEMNQLTAQIDHVADGLRFNGLTLLDGSFHEKQLQIGANAGDSMEVTIGSLKALPVPPEPPRFALWNVDRAIEAQDPRLNPFVIKSSVDGKEFKVPLEPFPANINDLIGQLQRFPGFSDAFRLQTGNISIQNSPDRPAANLIITATAPGTGAISVGAIPVASTTTPGGGTEVGTTPADAYADFYGKSLLGKAEVPAEYGGYHAREILLSDIDLTRQAGSSTPTRRWVDPVDGHFADNSNVGFGSASEAKIWVPKVEGYWDEGSTQSWGSGAQDAIGMIDRAIDIVSRGRAEIGAYQNRLEHTIRSASVGEENMAASESRIRDVDVAEEMAELTRSQILAQAGVSMLAQANQVPQSIMKLFPNG